MKGLKLTRVSLSNKLHSNNLRRLVIFFFVEARLTFLLSLTSSFLSLSSLSSFLSLLSLPFYLSLSLSLPFSLVDSFFQFFGLIHLPISFLTFFFACAIHSSKSFSYSRRLAISLFLSYWFSSLSNTSLSLSLSWVALFLSQSTK